MIGGGWNVWLSFPIKSATDDVELASHTDLVQEKVNDLGISRLDVERELCRRSFSHFVKEAWHVIEPSTKLKWGWAVEAICLHLQAVTEGEIQNLLAMVPPGTMKSLLVGVFWPAWEWGPCNMPHLRYIGTAHEETLAIRDNRRCRDLIKSPWYQKRWPMKMRADLDGKKEFGNDSTGFRNARAFKSMTGARGDRVLLDDPISAANANSMPKLKEAELIFLETLPTRINDQEVSSIVVIMQRLHQKDVAGIIIEKKLPYELLCIPMEFEPDRRCTTSIGWTDPRTEEGELMFPERFSRKTVDALKHNLGTYGTAGQLQQRPSPRGGGIIKEEWWGWWQVRPRTLWRMIYVDTAQKTGEENDYSVLQCWGMNDQGKIVLLDQIRDKWEAPDLDRRARQFWNKHRATPDMGPLRQMKVEDKVSGTGLIQALKRPQKLPDGGVQPAIPVASIQRNIDKISRAYSAAPQIEAGNVLLPMDAPWIDDYIAEFNDFPAGAHDDQCDPTFDAIEDMLGGVVKRPPPVGAPEGSFGPSVIEG